MRANPYSHLGIWCRPDSSDEFVVNEIFQADEYRLKGRDLFRANVVDIGANIGAFASKVRAISPTATIHCYEPDPGNFEMLEANAGGREGISLHNLAVFDRHGPLSFYSDFGSSAVSDDLGTLTVQAVTFESVLAQHDAIDLLKMDIEGGECECVMSASTEALRKVGSFAMEYHGIRPMWGEMVRRLSGLFHLEIEGHPFPDEAYGGMMFGTLRRAK